MRDHFDRIEDPVDPRSVRRAFKSVFAAEQRGKGLVGCVGLGYPMLSVDARGISRRRGGIVIRAVRSLTAMAVLPGTTRCGVHPAHREGFPLAPEPIRRADGSRKNDCEREAAKRREHPHRKLLVVEDALASNGPPIRGLEARDRRSVLGVKPGDHGEGFRWVDATAATRLVEMTRGGHPFRFRFLNGVPLNDANCDGEVNFLACWEVHPDGRTLPFSWVTGREVTESNAYELMRAGRARWRIKNETFKPLKNPGDGFEHPFGHGKPPRATGFAHRMMLAFLIDPMPQRCGSRF